MKEIEENHCRDVEDGVTGDRLFNYKPKDFPSCPLALTSLQLTGKILLFDFDNMFARYDNKSEVAVDQLHLDRRLSGGFTLGGGLCALRSRGLAIFVGILEDNVAIL